MVFENPLLMYTHWNIWAIIALILWAAWFLWRVDKNMREDSGEGLFDNMFDWGD